MNGRDNEMENLLSSRINATNPSQLELYLSLRPGGPESLEEAVSRVLRGEPVVQEEPGPADEKE